jgi:hypothetical protein
LRSAQAAGALGRAPFQWSSTKGRAKLMLAPLQPEIGQQHTRSQAPGCCNRHTDTQARSGARERFGVADKLHFGCAVARCRAPASAQHGLGCEGAACGVRHLLEDGRELGGVPAAAARALST